MAELTQDDVAHYVQIQFERRFHEQERITERLAQREERLKWWVRGLWLTMAVFISFFIGGGLYINSTFGDLVSWVHKQVDQRVIERAARYESLGMAYVLASSEDFPRAYPLLENFLVIGELDDKTIARFQSVFGGKGFIVSDGLSPIHRQLFFSTMLKVLALDSEIMSTGGYKGYDNWQQLLADHFFKTEFEPTISTSPWSSYYMGLGMLKFDFREPKELRKVLRGYFLGAIRAPGATKDDVVLREANTQLCLLALVEGNFEEAVQYGMNAHAEDIEGAPGFFDAWAGLAERSKSQRASNSVNNEELSQAWANLVNEVRQRLGSVALDAGLKNIREKIPDFELDNFLTVAQNDFQTITDAVATNQINRIAHRLSNVDTLWFLTNIENGQRLLGYSRKVAIMSLDKPKVISARIEGPIAQVEVEFKAVEQRSLLNKQGKAVFEEESSPTSFSGIWKYSYTLGKPHEVWKISYLRGI